MRSVLFPSAGELLHISCADRRLEPALVRAVRDGAVAGPAARTPTVTVDVQADAGPFSLRGLRPITRDAWSDGTRTVLGNACGSGLDLEVETGEHLVVLARYRPSALLRAANRSLRDRFELLAGQTLVHYPALWRGGWRGRVPLHVGVVATLAGVPMLAGPGGVGKSTVIAAALDTGASATADNLCCADETDCYGVVEPLRVSGDVGRGTTHGRVEQVLPGRVASLAPDRIVVLERGVDTRVDRATPDSAARAIVGGTYAAGELRRYWQFAATLALATGVGPTHPPVREVAAGYAERLPAICIRVGDGDRVGVTELVEVPS